MCQRVLALKGQPGKKPTAKGAKATGCAEVEWVIRSVRGWAVGQRAAQRL